jgi:hypothetical protein
MRIPPARTERDCPISGGQELEMLPFFEIVVGYRRPAEACRRRLSVPAAKQPK